MRHDENGKGYNLIQENRTSEQMVKQDLIIYDLPSNEMANNIIETT